jgi:hypothetical protein
LTENLSWKDSKHAVKDVDARVETLGQWTKGMTLIDRRIRVKAEPGNPYPSDHGGWLEKDRGNRLTIIKESPDDLLHRFGNVMIDRILN